MGKIVEVANGKYEGMRGNVLATGNGWVIVKTATVGTVAKRAYDLLVLVSPGSAEAVAAERAGKVPKKQGGKKRSAAAVAAAQQQQDEDEEDEDNKSGDERSNGRSKKRARTSSASSSIGSSSAPSRHNKSWSEDEADPLNPEEEEEEDNDDDDDGVGSVSGSDLDTGDSQDESGDEDNSDDDGDIGGGRNSRGSAYRVGSGDASSIAPSSSRDRSRSSLSSSRKSSRSRRNKLSIGRKRKRNTATNNRSNSVDNTSVTSTGSNEAGGVGGRRSSRNSSSSAPVSVPVAASNNGRTSSRRGSSGITGFAAPTSSSNARRAERERESSNRSNRGIGPSGRSGSGAAAAADDDNSVISNDVTAMSNSNGRRGVEGDLDGGTEDMSPYRRSYINQLESVGFNIENAPAPPPPVRNVLIGENKKSFIMKYVAREQTKIKDRPNLPDWKAQLQVALWNGAAGAGNHPAGDQLISRYLGTIAAARARAGRDVNNVPATAVDDIATSFSTGGSSSSSSKKIKSDFHNNKLLDGHTDNTELFEVAASRSFEEHIICDACGCELWPFATYCWSELCPTSPVYWEHTKDLTEQDWSTYKKESNNRGGDDAGEEEEDEEEEDVEEDAEEKEIVQPNNTSSTTITSVVANTTTTIKTESSNSNGSGSSMSHTADHSSSSTAVVVPAVAPLVVRGSHRSWRSVTSSSKSAADVAAFLLETPAMYLTEPPPAISNGNVNGTSAKIVVDRGVATAALTADHLALSVSEMDAEYERNSRRSAMLAAAVESI